MAGVCIKAEIFTTNDNEAAIMLSTLSSAAAAVAVDAAAADVAASATAAFVNRDNWLF